MSWIHNQTILYHKRKEETLLSINKVFLAALKALSYPDLNVKKNYKLMRFAINATHYHFLKVF